MGAIFKGSIDIEVTANDAISDAISKVNQLITDFESFAAVNSKLDNQLEEVKNQMLKLQEAGDVDVAAYTQLIETLHNLESKIGDSSSKLESLRNDIKDLSDPSNAITINVDESHLDAVAKYIDELTQKAVTLRSAMAESS